MRHQPFTLLIHIALAIIVAGAIVTHFFGIQGELTLSAAAGPVTDFEKTSGPGDGKFPFDVSLDSADIKFYPGTSTPMDFSSHLVIDGRAVTVSMNNVAQVRGWRFYQSGIGPDSSRLSVSYDPWGTGITYSGYALLFVGMTGFFFQRHTYWRSLLKAGRKTAVAIVCVAALGANAGTKTTLPVMQKPLAANLGKAYVYWNDRICPLQTMARDVTLKLYGSYSYEGMTAEQVLSGWLFYFDTWERDYNAAHVGAAGSEKQKKLHDERMALIYWLGTGEAFKIYPYHAADGHIEWLSLTGQRPSRVSLEQWAFMQTTMPEIKALLLEGRNVDANKAIDSLIAGQIRYAGRENLPSPAKMQAERIYNGYANLLIPAVISLLLGIFYLYIAIKGPHVRRLFLRCADAAVIVLTVYLTAILALLWWIGDHIPISNGPEMMLFMSCIATVCSLTCRNRFIRGAFLIVSAMTLAVGVMGGRTPRIGMLMPVLSSPLLSVHVMLVMTAYVLFLIMSVLAVIGLSSRNNRTVESLSRINRLMLVPAVFLLAGGIFVGAVWANQSWGRYWGWDPKETCALVMLLIYSVPLHRGSSRLKVLRSPKALNRYLLCAVLSVLFTYFGANYFLSGLHSYA